MAVLDLLDCLPRDPPARQAIDINPEMILQIATGMEEPMVIAGRFGITAEEFTLLSQWPPFQSMVASKREELAKAGTPFKIKSAFYCEDVMDRTYLAMCSPDATIPQRLDFIRTTAAFADLVPKPASTVNSGTGFSISIVFPPGMAPTPAPPTRTIEGEVSVAGTAVQTS